MSVFVFFFQAEDGIRDLVRSRGLGDVYKRQDERRRERELRRRLSGHGDRQVVGRLIGIAGLLGLSLIHI